MDWKEVIAELGRLGMRQPDIAAACGCSQSAVSQLANGHIKDPRHSIGEAMRNLLAMKRAEQGATGRAATPSDGAGAVSSAVEH